MYDEKKHPSSSSPQQRLQVVKAIKKASQDFLKKSNVTPSKDATAAIFSPVPTASSAPKGAAPSSSPSTAASQKLALVTGAHKAAKIIAQTSDDELFAFLGSDDFTTVVTANQSSAKNQQPQGQIAMAIGGAFIVLGLAGTFYQFKRFSKRIKDVELSQVPPKTLQGIWEEQVTVLQEKMANIQKEVDPIGWFNKTHNDVRKGEHSHYEHQATQDAFEAAQAKAEKVAQSGNDEAIKAAIVDYRKQVESMQEQFKDATEETILSRAKELEDVAELVRTLTKNGSKEEYIQAFREHMQQTTKALTTFKIPEVPVERQEQQQQQPAVGEVKARELTLSKETADRIRNFGEQPSATFFEQAGGCCNFRSSSYWCGNYALG